MYIQNDKRIRVALTTNKDPIYRYVFGSVVWVVASDTHRPLWYCCREMLIDGLRWEIFSLLLVAVGILFSLVRVEFKWGE